MLNLSARRAFVAAALSLGMIGAAHANDIVVAPGAGTLNTAVTNAPNGSRLLLQDGNYTLTGTISISGGRTLTIQSQSGNAANVVIDLTGRTTRAFTITGTGTNVTINRVTFANATMAAVRGVYVSVQSSAVATVDGIIARNATVGRGTVASEGGTLNIRNSTFRNNTTSDRGAAIFGGTNAGTSVFIEDSLVENNTAATSSPGAVISLTRGVMDIRGLTYRNNQTGGPTTTAGFGQIAAWVGFTGFPVQLTIRNSLIENNTHTVAQPTNTNDGIVAALGQATTNGNSLTVRDTTFRNNRLIAADSTPTGRGIVLTRDQNVAFTFTNNTVESNSAAGGIVMPTSNLAATISGNVFRSNTSTISGALDLSFDNLAGEGVTVISNTFENNTGHVGGLFIGKLADSTLVTDNRFLRNTGTNNDHGGAITVRAANVTITRNYFEGNRKTVGWGPGIWISRTTTVRNNTFIGNIGDGVIGQNGGAPVIEDNRFQFNTGGGAFTMWYGSPEIRRNVIVGNEGGGFVAFQTPTGTFENNYVASNMGADAGGLGLYQVGTFEVVHNTIVSNFQTDPAASGGGVRVISAPNRLPFVQLTGNLIYGNEAAGAGDQIGADAGSSLAFLGNNIQNNSPNDIDGTTYDGLSVDPLLWNLTFLGGQPRINSPILGAGQPGGLSTDISGNNRNLNNPTIGAYEGIRGNQIIYSFDWSGTVDAPTPAEAGIFLRLQFTDPTGVRPTVLEYIPFTNEAAEGNYALMGSIAPGAYNLCVSAVRITFTPANGNTPASFSFAPTNFLSRQMQVNVVSGTVLSHTGMLLASGDSDGSGMIDDADLTNLILDFGGAPGAGSGFDTDFNGDGMVDDADLTVLILNFGAFGNACN